MTRNREYRMRPRKTYKPTKGGAFGGNGGGVINIRPRCVIHKTSYMQLKIDSITGRRFWCCRFWPGCEYVQAC